MINSIIAKNLKAFRATRKWSLAKAAEQTSVSKAMLGQIEREESSPTMATLWKIAQGFHVPMSSLLEERTIDFQSGQSQYRSSLSPSPLIAFDNNIEFTVLFPYDPVLCCEMFAHNVKLGKTHLSQAHEQGVVEDIIVIKGELGVLVNGQWQNLIAGETLRFLADTPHGYRNLGSQVAIFHNIIHYPKSVTNT